MGNSVLEGHASFQCIFENVTFNCVVGNLEKLIKTKANVLIVMHVFEAGQ